MSSPSIRFLLACFKAFTHALPAPLLTFFDAPAPFNRQVIEVTGGQELTVVSTADSAVMSNVRFEVRDSTKLVLDIPDLTITGVVDSVGKIVP